MTLKLLARSSLATPSPICESFVSCEFVRLVKSGFSRHQWIECQALREPLLWSRWFVGRVRILLNVCYS